MCHTPAVQSFVNELQQHREGLEQEIGRIAKELKEMQHIHARQNAEVDVAGLDHRGQYSDGVRTLSVHRGQEISANEERIQDSVVRGGCRRRRNHNHDSGTQRQHGVGYYKHPVTIFQTIVVRFESVIRAVQRTVSVIEGLLIAGDLRMRVHG